MARHIGIVSMSDLSPACRMGICQVYGFFPILSARPNENINQTADHEIAKRIVDMFAWNVSIPDDKITVKVEHGWVTLSGKVDWFYQKDEAMKAAGKVNGVTGVSNLIEIRQMPTSTDVRARIMSAIKRQADLDADRITVLADGGKVTLGGKVSAWNERQIAERAAWSAPGVTKVEDNILVSL